MEKQKFVKVMFGTKSGASGFEYKIDELNISNNWNPTAKNGRDFGGFNFSTPDKILRWLHRGDTLYDVSIPEDAEVIDIVDCATPHGVIRSNKIIISNPRPVTDEMTLEFYKISTIPEESYPKALAAVSVRNYRKTAEKILRDKVNEKNIEFYLSEWNDFTGNHDKKDFNETVSFIDECLNEINDKRLITLFINREPYEKIITSDNIINITGQSGSGKTTYTKDYLTNDNYIVIDTDEIKGNRETTNKHSLEIRNYLLQKYGDNIPNLGTDFDTIYRDILNYYKDTKKTLVIDCAQFHCIKDINLLKGKIIILRTCIDECYKRCIERYKKVNPNYTEEELENYKNRKISIYKWYKGSNDFIKRIDSEL